MVPSEFNHASPQDAGDLAVLCNRYQLQQRLGKKAGRQTWLAIDLQTEQLVVIKLLTFSNEFEWDDLKLFEREAETLRSLSHAAIPQYLDYFECSTDSSKGFALVQTYLNAKSLEQHLQAGRSFSEGEVKQLAKELLGILSYLHDRQPPVIHRDLKPSNILLTNRSGNNPGQVYLVDFGSVQTLAAREGGTVTVVGTYGYMPPEQFGGRSVPASDLYSLGATLIYLVTGQHPADLPQTDLRIEFESFAKLSPGFTHWLKWMTQPSLSQRPASVQQALDELHRPQPSSASGRPSVRFAIAKPTHTKIQLVHGKHQLQLVLPSRQLTVPATWSHGWVLVMLVPWLIAVPYLLPLGAATLLSFALLACFWGKTRLRIDEGGVTIVRELFGWQYERRPTVPKRHVWKLERVGTRSSSQLYVWIGTQRCEIQASTQELDWIAYELAKELDLD